MGEESWAAVRAAALSCQALEHCKYLWKWNRESRGVKNEARVLTARAIVWKSRET